jgi:hypothetical protein
VAANAFCVTRAVERGEDETDERGDDPVVLRALLMLRAFFGLVVLVVLVA